jgi:phenylalanyl-tRNA synthetase alpha chain
MIIDKDKLIEELQTSLNTTVNTTQIIELRNAFVKKHLGALYLELKNPAYKDKATLGKTINEIKEAIFTTCDNLINKINEKNETSNHLVNYDVTINTSDFSSGAINPITMVIDDIAQYFRSLNFTIQSGEEVVDVKYGFDNLNISPTHPTRDTSETFYVDKQRVLRTQCTASSAKFIDNNKEPEIRIMNYGCVYRNDDDDASHSHQFNQIDFV